ncbi:MAG TPA: alanine racemase [Clostridiales bacterium UBA8960]|jgi:alanine racemase|nr:alanine racemase [Clostridiales bacterium UBA8960]
MDRLTRPVWADINLDHLAHNIREVRRVTNPKTLISAVIKADGYGHGAVAIGQTLLDHGADRFAVATLSEALQLKRAFSETEIMVLGYTPNDLIDEAILKGIIQTVFSIEQAKTFNDRASKLGKTLKVHIKVDTGMRRIGMAVSEETINQVVEITQMKNLFVEGIFTHFATADETDKTFTKAQVEKFLWVVDKLEQKGVRINIKHVSNSAAIIDCPEYNFDMVRAGIMLYGLYPSPDVNHDQVKLKEVMSLKANIAQVKMIEKGEGVSYGLKYIASAPTQIATIPIGYADGFTRSLTFKAKGIINGVVKPIVGRICMDQCMLEVDGLSVAPGDTVTLFGEMNGERISIDDYANMLGTINYEIVCMIGKRVPRRYLSEGKTLNVVDFILG